MRFVSSYKGLVLFSLLALAGCSAPSSSSSWDQINEIQNIAVPITTANVSTPEVSKSAITGVHQENKAQLDHLTAALKSGYLQNANHEDMFKSGSKVHSVYAALTKLEELSEMNDIYLTQGDVSGLRKINSLIKPLKTHA